MSLDLWTATGTKLATATFTNTSASGWQTVALATPVSITANTTYVASYHTTGAYVATDNFFTSAVTNGPLTAPSSATAGGNGVYALRRVRHTAFSRPAPSIPPTTGPMWSSGRSSPPEASDEVTEGFGWG